MRQEVKHYGFHKHVIKTHTFKVWRFINSVNALLKACQGNVTIGMLPDKICTSNLSFFFCLRLLFSLKLSVL